jgi:hypothetical protein
MGKFLVFNLFFFKFYFFLLKGPDSFENDSMGVMGLTPSHVQVIGFLEAKGSGDGIHRFYWIMFTGFWAAMREQVKKKSIAFIRFIHFIIIMVLIYKKKRNELGICIKNEKNGNLSTIIRGSKIPIPI